MTAWRTTLIGAVAAIAIAVKPVLDGSGYNFDTKTIAELCFAVIIALGGYYAQDRKVNN
jgi:hypothetical protein